MVPIVIFASLIIGFLLMSNRSKRMQFGEPAFGLVMMLASCGVLVCWASDSALADSNQTLGKTQMLLLMHQNSPDQSAPTAGIQEDKEKDESKSGDDAKLDDIDSTVPISTGKRPIPDWVLNQPESNSDFEFVVVSTDPVLSLLDVEKELDRLMEQVVAERISDVIHEGAGAVVGIDAETIKEKWLVPGHIHKAPYEGQIATMYRGYAQLKLDNELYKMAEGKWTTHLKWQRLFQIALVAGSLLSVLAVAFSYFKIDNASQSLYTGRLQIFAIILILAVVGAAVHFGNQIDWF